MPETQGMLDEQRIADLVRNITRIDRMLENSVTTIIDFMKRAENDPCKLPLFVATTGEPFEERMYHVPYAIACSTLLRIDVLRRRLAFLQKGNAARDLTALVAGIRKHFGLHDVPSGSDKEIFKYLGDHLSSSTFGALNPLTASWVFWTLMYAGEAYAHSGLGFLAFFAMWWALERGRPTKEQPIAGAGADPWRPTAYITARCLFPIEMMIGTCERRADRFEKVKTLLGELENLSGSSKEHDRWIFALKLDAVSGVLREMSIIAIDPKTFKETAENLANLAADLTCNEDVGKCWTETKRELAKMLRALGQFNQTVIDNAAEMVEGFIPRLISILKNKTRRNLLIDKQCHQFRKDASPEEWQAKITAAKKALDLCQFALDSYKRSITVFANVGENAHTETIQHAFDQMAAANREIKKRFEEEIKHSLEWCDSIVNLESARASAGSHSEFDATELVQAMAVRVRAQKMTTLQVKDAVAKALLGKRDDGSWAPGKPFFIQNRVLGAWSTTSETIWTLASAIVSHPEITEADDTLLAFVDWLEKTQQMVREPDHDGVRIGWSSERFLQLGTVDTWATCNAINALVPIRTLLEYRLWEICEQNFTVVEHFRQLHEVDPTDLSKPHGQRLHRQLMETAWQTGKSAPGARYALILHGPPGTSKTTLAGAFAQQLWRTTQFAKRPEPASSTSVRMVRITPADFMHGGEARIDERAGVIFKLLSHIRAATIFFDEIDDFLERREFKSERNFIKLVVPAMLNRLQDLRDAAPLQEICFVLGTNYVDKIDPALIRPGRVDEAFAVVYPDLASKKAIAQRLAVPEHWISFIAGATLFWPYQPFVMLCDRLASHSGKELTENDVRAMMEDLEAQVDLAERAYQDPQRWRLADGRFLAEYESIVFSHGRAAAGSFADRLDDQTGGPLEFPAAAIKLIRDHIQSTAGLEPPSDVHLPIKKPRPRGERPRST